MRTIAIVNQKGGCGKTTTAINLASVFARRGLRTLIVDMDPQAHCAAGLGVPEGQLDFSISEALLSDLSRGLDRASLVWEVASNLHLAPSTMRLAALEAPGGGLHELPDRDRRLERVLEHLGDGHDLCLIDCPPTIGLLTFNAMRAAREALIPVETGYFSLKGAERQWETIQRVIRRIGRPIACHILPTLFDPDSQIACDVLGALRRQFAGQILPMEIREHEELREAASMGQGVIEFAPDSEARADYEQLADWLQSHEVSPSPDIEIVPRSAPPTEPLAARRSDEPHHAETHQMLHGPRLPVTPLGTEEGLARGQASPGGRAVELVERLRRPEERWAETPVAEPVAPPIAPLRMVDPVVEPSTRPVPEHLYGVRSTRHGVLFVQPADGAASIGLAGEFNGWRRQDLHDDPTLGVKQAMLPLSPGRYQYRLIVDGRWQPDPYNELTVMNPHGELNSVLVVPDSQMTS